MYSIQSDGQYLYIGRNSSTKKEAVETVFEWFFKGNEFCDDFKKCKTVEQKETYLRGFSLLVVENSIFIED